MDPLDYEIVEIADEGTQITIEIQNQPVIEYRPEGGLEPGAVLDGGNF